MGAVNSLLANMLDGFEAEETEVKADKLAPKPAPKAKAKAEPKAEPEAKDEDSPSFEDFESQLALEELEMENDKKEVPKFKGKGRKIAPLKRK